MARIIATTDLQTDFTNCNLTTTRRHVGQQVTRLLSIAYLYPAEAILGPAFRPIYQPFDLRRTVDSVHVRGVERSVSGRGY